ncbi:MAG TPA: glycosyltransferase family 4 protein [Clostridia bacterium]
MRICFVHNFYKQFGGEDDVVQNMTSLLGKKNEVILFTRDSKSISSIKSKIKLISGIEGKNSVRDLVSFINNNKPDVVHFHNVFPMITPSAYTEVLKMNVPIVQTIHNFRFFCVNGLLQDRNGEICTSQGNYLKCIREKCYRNSAAQTYMYTRHLKKMKREDVLKRFDGVIVLSEFMKNFIENEIPGIKNLNVIPNFTYGRSNEIPVSEREKSYYLYIGRLSEEKGLMSLVKAFKGKEWQLKIAGSGPLEFDLKKIIKEEKLSNVHLVGFVQGEEKDNLICNSKAILLPSEWLEQLPISAIDGLSRSIPLLVSKNGGLTSIVEDGVNGFKFTAGNIPELEKAIEKIEEVKLEGYENICKGAFVSWKNKYSPEVFENSILTLYQKVIEKRGIVNVI